MELKEKELLELIESKEKFVLKVYMDSCPFCKEFAPIFDEAAKNRPGIKFVSFKRNGSELSGSEFAKKYMTVNGKEKLSAPALFVFEDGGMKYRHYGKLSLKDFSDFMEMGKSPNQAKDQARVELIDLFAKKGEIMTLHEQLPEMNKRIKELQQFLES